MQRASPQTPSSTLQPLSVRWQWRSGQTAHHAMARSGHVRWDRLPDGRERNRRRSGGKLASGAFIRLGWRSARGEDAASEAPAVWFVALILPTSTPLITRRTPGTWRARSTANCSCSGVLAEPVSQTSGPSTLTFNRAPRSAPSASADRKRSPRFLGNAGRSLCDGQLVDDLTNTAGPPSEIQRRPLLGGRAHSAFQPNVAILDVKGMPNPWSCPLCFASWKRWVISAPMRRSSAGLFRVRGAGRSLPGRACWQSRPVASDSAAVSLAFVVPTSGLLSSAPDWSLFFCLPPNG